MKVRALMLALAISVVSASSAAAEARKPEGVYEMFYRMMGWPLPKPRPPVIVPPPEAPPVVVRPPTTPKAAPPKAKPKPKVKPKPKAKAKGLPSCAFVRREYERMTVAERWAAYWKATPEEVAHGRRCLGM